MKAKIICFFICLGCTITLKNNICVYASDFNTSTTTNDSAYIDNDSSETPTIKETHDNIVRISNSDEFIDNLSNGNSIILDSNIELDVCENFSTKDPISINTNGYGITITSGNVITFYGQFEFCGGSNANPIFTIKPGSLLSLNNSSLTVDNDNTTGVYINRNSFFSLNNCNVSVDGDNGIGIYSDNKIDDHSIYINHSKLNVNSNNSIGIKCTKDVNLLYDILTCSGKNSVIIDSPKIVLDSCNTDTIPDNTTIINRYVSNIYAPSYQAALNSNKINLQNYITITLKDKKNSAPNQQVTLNVTWDDTADYNTIGEYEIIGEIINPYSTVPINELIDAFPDTVKTTIYIKDPNILDISYIGSVDTFNNLITVVVEFLKAPLNSDDNILYYSTDDGITWIAYPNDSYALNDDQLSICDLEFNKDYLFQYVLSDGTKSNFLKININSDGTYTNSSIGGDRDNGDLGSNKPPLHIVKPDTDNNSENSSNTNTLDSKNSYSSSSSNRKHNSSNDSSSYSDSSNIYIIGGENTNNIKSNDDSNLIIMNTNNDNSTFINGTLEDKANYVEEKILLSNPDNLNNSITSSNAIADSNIDSSSIKQSNATNNIQSNLTDNYKEDSVRDVQAEKKQETDNVVATPDVNVTSEEKNINIDASSIKETEKNSNDSSIKNYIPFVTIMASLVCVISFLFIKKGKK